MMLECMDVSQMHYFKDTSILLKEHGDKETQRLNQCMWLYFVLRRRSRVGTKTSNFLVSELHITGTTLEDTGLDNMLDPYLSQKIDKQAFGISVALFPSSHVFSKGLPSGFSESSYL